MRVNKKNRSLWGSRSEAQRIYYQRQTIKRLEKENNQLKEQKQELRSWLEEIIPYLKVHGIRTTPDKVLEDVLNKLNVLEGKNE